MTNKKRAAKNGKVFAPSKGDDWLLRFLRQHSLGVILLALLSAGGGWLVWHSRDCVTEQKAQIAAARKAWLNFRMAHEKWMDDADTWVTRVEIYRRNEAIGDRYEALDQNRKALFEIGQTLSKGCNDVKATTYELDGQLKELGRLFPFYTPSKLGFDPELCGRMLGDVEHLRLPEFTDPWNSDTPESDSVASKPNLKERIATFRERIVKVDQSVESFFVMLENMSLARRVKQCF